MRSTREPLETLTLPLDVARSALLRATGGPLRAVLTDRERRVAMLLAIAMLSSLALTVAAPLWLLAVGPVVLGVPHLLADWRYLVAREGLHRRALAWLCVGAPIALGSALDARFATLSIAGAALVATSAAPARRLATVALGALLLFAHTKAQRPFELVFAHAHNFIAVALWLAWRPRARRWHGLLAVAFVLVNVAIVTGALDGAIAWAGGLSRGPESLQLGRHMMALAPMPEHIDLSRRLVLAFAFSQSVHYAVWLRVIPEEARRTKTGRSFAQSARALTRELGTMTVWLTLAACAGLALWATTDLARARDGYLRVAACHGYVELAVMALWFIERRTGPREEPAT